MANKIYIWRIFILVRGAHFPFYTTPLSFGPGITYCFASDIIRIISLIFNNRSTLIE